MKLETATKSVCGSKYLSLIKQAPSLGLLYERNRGKQSENWKEQRKVERTKQPSQILTPALTHTKCERALQWLFHQKLHRAEDSQSQSFINKKKKTKKKSSSNVFFPLLSQEGTHNHVTVICYFLFCPCSSSRPSCHLSLHDPCSSSSCLSSCCWRIATCSTCTIISFALKFASRLEISNKRNPV